MEIKSSEFFKNMTVFPKIGTKEFDDLVKWEEEKCIGGVNINGVYISGWLYWHLNHWWIRIDKQDEHGNDIRVASLPDLRDNEWIRAEMLEQCRVLRKGYIEIGARQGGKSEMEASYLGYNAILFENTQNLVIGSNDSDLSLIKDKIDFGLKKLWEGINIPRLDKTWKSNMIRLGYKLPSGDDDIWSYLVIRNTDGGKNTEAGAGTTAKAVIFDEIGKSDFAKVYEAIKPALNSKFGLRAVPILVGTGGSFDKGQDAERYWHHPEENGFLGLENEGTSKKTGLFLSGLYRQDCKKLSTLSQWLHDEKGLDVRNKKELDKIEMWVADKDAALKKINEERELKKKDPDQTEYLKVIMYHPLTIEECFLTSSDNIFNVRGAKAQQQRLYDNQIVATNVFLFHDGENIRHETVEKKPISQFPHKPIDDKDAPIEIWEMPIKDPPFGLYVAGVDPYRHAKSKYSNSLGVVYIYKRLHDLTSEKFQDTFVACYAARPDDKDKWNEQARLLIKFYNARVLCENDEMSFIEYMKAKGDQRYLESRPAWLREIVPNTTTDREYGIHRSSPKIREYLDGCLKSYLNTKLTADELDENGSVTREGIMGVYQIRDPMLLEEIIQFNEDDNFDRIIAAELAIALSLHLNPLIKVSNTEDDVRYKSLYKQKSPSGGLFSSESNLFSSTKRRINKLFS